MPIDRRPRFHLLLVALAGACRCAPVSVGVDAGPAPVDAGDTHRARIVCPVDWDALAAAHDAAPVAPEGHAPAPDTVEEAEDGDGPPELPANAELDAWLTAANRALDDDHLDIALACAQEASRAFPDVPATHRIRAAVLDAQDDLDAARAALDRALALDPDDPDTLHDLAAFLLRLGSDDALEAAVAHCRRAREGIGAQDVETAAGLAATEAAALNDLGRGQEAAAAAETALALDETRDDARLERAVALLETLRFAEARTALEEISGRLPDDPRAAWYLALSLERDADPRAKGLFLRASTLDPEAYPAPLEMDAPTFQALVDAELAQLRIEKAEGLDGVRVTVEALPAEEDLRAGEPVLSPSIIGLYRPPEEGSTALPTVVLYRLGLLRLGHDVEALRHEVRRTLLHELGHHAGEDDAALRDRGL